MRYLHILVLSLLLTATGFAQRGGHGGGGGGGRGFGGGGGHAVSGGGGFGGRGFAGGAEASMAGAMDVADTATAALVTATVGDSAWASGSVIGAVTYIGMVATHTTRIPITVTRMIPTRTDQDT